MYLSFLVEYSMSSPLRILGFSGSLRKASTNTGLLRAAATVLPEGVTLDIFDLAPIPLYNGDVEAAGAPDSVLAFKAAVAAADALLIAAPEYNYSVAGVLKNAIDWASRPPKTSPFMGKPVAIMGAGGMSGTMRGQAHLRNILASNAAWVLPKPEVMVPSMGKFDPEGNLTNDDVRASIGALLVALADFTRKMRS
jgi:chromate reductase